MDLGRDDQSPDDGAARLPPDLLGYLAGLFGLVDAAVPTGGGSRTRPPGSADDRGPAPERCSTSSACTRLGRVPPALRREPRRSSSTAARSCRAHAQAEALRRGRASTCRAACGCLPSSASAPREGNVPGDPRQALPPPAEPAAGRRCRRPAAVRDRSRSGRLPGGRPQLPRVAGRRRRAPRSTRCGAQARLRRRLPPAALLYLLLRHALDLGYGDTGHRAARLEPGARPRPGRAWPGASRVPPRRRGGRLTRQPHGSTSTGQRRSSPATRSLCSASTSRTVLVQAARPVPERAARGARPLAGVRPGRGSNGRWPSTSTAAPTVSTPGAVGSSATQLALMRGDDGGSADGETPSSDGRRGVLIGAYGWLEDVRPRAAATRARRRCDPELAAIFQREGDAPLGRDAGNGGLHPRAVARPRRHGRGAPQRLPRQRDARQPRRARRQPRRPRGSGPRWPSSRDPQRPEPRRAARLPAGARPARPRTTCSSSTGSSSTCARRFPLVGDRLTSTSTEDPDVPVAAVEARNVVDGLALVEHLDEAGPNPTYPFGIDGLPTLDDLAAATPLTPAQVGAVDRRRRGRGCATSTTPSPTSRWPRACTRPSGATTTAPPATLDAVRQGQLAAEPDVVRDAARRASR